MYNKYRFNKMNDKKLLHKVKKQWVVLSLAMFMMIGGGAIATHVTASADQQTDQSVATIHSTDNSGTSSNHVQNQNITQRANNLHTALVRKSNQQTMRVGSYRSQHPVVKGHYAKTNSKRRLRTSGYGRMKTGYGSQYFVYNRYAPNSRRAVVPRRFKVFNDLTWVVGTKRKILKYQNGTDMYMYRRSRHGWMLFAGNHKFGCRRTRHYYRKPAKRHSRSGLYVSRLDSDGTNLYISNADIKDMQNYRKDSDSDFSDDYVKDQVSSPLKIRVTKTMKLNGYRLDQINHHVSGVAGNVWVFPKELSHKSSRMFDVWNDFDNLTMAAIKHNKKVMSRINKNNYNAVFTSDEKSKINNIKQEYKDLKQHENPTSDGDLNDLRHDVIDWVNFYRTDLYNLQPVSENGSYDDRAQQGAEDGQDPEDMTPASTSSDALSPETYVDGYFTDNGNLDNNGETGHRDSVLNPLDSQIGVGQDGQQNALFFDWGINGQNVSNGQTSPSDVVAYPNEGVFPLSDAQNGEYWSYQFASHPYEMGSGDYSPEVSVHDDTNNKDVSVGNVTAAADEVYYAVDTNALHANHQYTITIDGLPTGDVQYSTKLFNL